MNTVTKNYRGAIIKFVIIEGSICMNISPICNMYRIMKSDFFKLRSTQRFLDEFIRTSPHSVFVHSGLSNLKGCYITEELMYKFASWVDVRFDVWFTQNIKEIKERLTEAELNSILS